MMIFSQDGEVLVNEAKVAYFDIDTLPTDQYSIYVNFAGEGNLVIGTYASSDEASAALHRIYAAIMREYNTFTMPKYGFFTEEERKRI